MRLPSSERRGSGCRGRRANSSSEEQLAARKLRTRHKIRILWRVPKRGIFYNDMALAEFQPAAILIMKPPIRVIS